MSGRQEHFISEFCAIGYRGSTALYHNNTEKELF